MLGSEMDAHSLGTPLLGSVRQLTRGTPSLVPVPTR